ncbi:hypothetical protein LCGC14_0282160 [marine sediment metagenome]|uniref:DNA-binding protein HU n=1 Tax=marine sediment metagenome TaxID=412755 RepID=A0A0F9UCD0_9ZZZZ
MNKQDLITAMSEQTMMTKAQCEGALNALLDTVSNTLARGESVSLIGFGRFDVRKREERSGRNPQTGKPLLLPAKNVPAFKPGSQLKAVVN